MTVPVFVSVGANLGDPLNQVERALSRLQERYGMVERAALFLTEPVGGPPQPPFVNTVFHWHTTDSPREVLAGLQAIEAEMGRRRDGTANAPRVIDLDLILYGDLVVQEPGLEIPHPRFRQRAFVLVPFASRWPAVVDPVTGKTIGKLAAELEDRHWVRPIEAPAP